mgnify:CR=1 FL=1
MKKLIMSLLFFLTLNACQPIEKVNHIVFDNSQLARFNILSTSVEIKEIFECKKKVTTIKHIENIELFEIVVTQPKERIDDCVICYQNYGKEKVGILKCNHKFHQKCIEKWLHVSKNKDCPLCRS